MPWINFPSKFRIGRARFYFFECPCRYPIYLQRNFLNKTIKLKIMICACCASLLQYGATPHLNKESGIYYVLLRHHISCVKSFSLTLRLNILRISLNLINNMGYLVCCFLIGAVLPFPWSSILYEYKQIFNRPVYSHNKLNPTLRGLLVWSVQFF